MKKNTYFFYLVVIVFIITSCMYQNEDDTNIQKTYEYSEENSKNSIENIGEISDFTEEDNRVKDVVEKFLTLYQALDGDAGKYLADRPEGEEIRFNGVQALLAKRITFSIEDIKMEDNKYFVNTQINTVDVRVAFENVINVLDEENSEDIILEKLYNTIDSETSQTRNFLIEIPVQKYGEEYKIKLTSELSNALFGGYNEYLSEMIGGMLNE